MPPCCRDTPGPGDLGAASRPLESIRVAAEISGLRAQTRSRWSRASASCRGGRGSRGAAGSRGIPRRFRWVKAWIPGRRRKHPCFLFSTFLFVGCPSLFLQITFDELLKQKSRTHQNKVETHNEAMWGTGPLGSHAYSGKWAIETQYHPGDDITGRGGTITRCLSEQRMGLHSESYNEPAYHCQGLKLFSGMTSQSWTSPGWPSTSWTCPFPRSAPSWTCCAVTGCGGSSSETQKRENYNGVSSFFKPVKYCLYVCQKLLFKRFAKK